MAFRSSGSDRPQYSISTSVFIRKGKYIKGPSFGLWEADSGPMMRGSVKEKYLAELIAFLEKAQERDASVSFSLFKNDTGKKKRSNDDDEEEWGSKRKEKDEDDEPAPKKKRAPVEEEEEEPAPKKKKKPVEEEEEEKPAKKGKKKSEWDFD